ncbi:MAG: hypothetical protein ACMG51_04740 [Ginsengibacter sp.]
MNPNYNDEEEIVVKRPTLLTVLCILTFVGSSYAILGSLYAYKQAHVLSANIHNAMEKNRVDSVNMKDSVKTMNKRPESGKMRGFMKGMEKVYDEKNMRTKAIGDIIAALFTLGGAILMWQRKRAGYFLYILGILLGIALPFYLYGNNLMAVGISSFGSFFGLIFIALYSLNLSYLKKPLVTEY